MGGRAVSVQTSYMLPARGKKRGRKRKPGCRGKGGAGVYPALKNIGVAHGVTPALCEDVTLSALNNTFDEAADSLKRRGIDISPKRVRAVSENFAAATLEIRGKDLADYKNGESVSAPVLRGARVAVCLDGGRINIRTPKKGRIPANAKRRGFHSNWREPKLFTIYSLDEEGKRLKGSPSFCDGTISGPEKTLDLLAAQLHRLGVGGAKELVFISDGASWIWKRLDSFISAIGFPADGAVKVLDLCHAVSHLAAIADLLPGRSGKQKKRWLNKMKTLLKEASPDDFLDELSRAVGKSRNKKLRTEFNYFLKNREHISYADFIARRIPIGSGSVESAIRRVVNLRLKGAGMFWLKHNAEGFLHLRCQTKTGNWNAFFRRTLQTMCGGV
jgi:hypothetical protein